LSDGEIQEQRHRALAPALPRARMAVYATRRGDNTGRTWTASRRRSAVSAPTTLRAATRAAPTATRHRSPWRIGAPSFR